VEEETEKDEKEEIELEEVPEEEVTEEVAEEEVTETTEEPKAEVTEKETVEEKEVGSFKREMHKAICADCGKECEVPFTPIEGRKIYCRDCYRKHGMGERRRRF
jgi:CxxC-x17-CxxC domain-containing protein